MSLSPLCAAACRTSSRASPLCRKRPACTATGRNSLTWTHVQKCCVCAHPHLTLMADDEKVPRKIRDFMDWNVRAMGEPVACGNQLHSKTPRCGNYLCRRKAQKSLSPQKPERRELQHQRTAAALLWRKGYILLRKRVLLSLTANSSKLHFDRPGLLAQKSIKRVGLSERRMGLATRRTRHVRRAF